jgi:microcystin-dependent protein
MLNNYKFLMKILVILFLLNSVLLTNCDPNLKFLQEPTQCGSPIECYLNAIGEIKNMKTQFQETITKLKEDQQKKFQEQEKLFKDKIQKLESLTPIIGSIVYHSSMKNILNDQDLPYGWIYCDGRNLKISEYSELYSIIGNTYGQVDTNSFNIPDLRGRVIIGTGQGSGLSDYKIGQKGGEENHYLTAAEMPNHGHSINAKFMYINSSNNGGYANRVKMPYIEFDGAIRWQSWQYPATGQDSISSYSTGGNLPHNNMQPYLSIHPIIKAK